MDDAIADNLRAADPFGRFLRKQLGILQERRRSSCTFKPCQASTAFWHLHPLTQSVLPPVTRLVLTGAPLGVVFYLIFLFVSRTWSGL